MPCMLVTEKRTVRGALRALCPGRRVRHSTRPYPLSNLSASCDTGSVSYNSIDASGASFCSALNKSPFALVVALRITTNSTRTKPR